MESVRLGRSEREVSRGGLGCNNFGGRVDREGTRRVVHAALDAGITFFDTAETYGGGDSERFLGAALGERRSQVVLATKFGWAPGDLPGGAPERVRRSIDASLERLGTDVVDLYYYHRPDGVTPLAETLGAMQELVDAGKVRRLGLSNVDVALLSEANASDVEVVAVQNRYSLVDRRDEDGVLPFCRDHAIGYVPYFPLGSAFPGMPKVTENDVVRSIAERIGASPAQVGLAWLLAHRENVLLIPGTSSVAHLEENLAVGEITLSDDDVAELDKIAG